MTVAHWVRLRTLCMMMLVCGWMGCAGSGPNPCVPNTVQACDCPEGLSGLQVCSSSGDWSPELCVCSVKETEDGQPPVMEDVEEPETPDLLDGVTPDVEMELEEIEDVQQTEDEDVDVETDIGLMEDTEIQDSEEGEQGDSIRVSPSMQQRKMNWIAPSPSFLFLMSRLPDLPVQEDGRRVDLPVCRSRTRSSRTGR